MLAMLTSDAYSLQLNEQVLYLIAEQITSSLKVTPSDVSDQQYIR